MDKLCPLANISAQPVSVTREASPSAIFMTNPHVSFAKPRHQLELNVLLFVLSLASRSFIHGEALEWTRIILFPLPFRVPLAEGKKKKGLIHVFRNEMINPDSKGTTFINVSFCFVRQVKSKVFFFCPFSSDASGTGRGGGRKVDGY